MVEVQLEGFVSRFRYVSLWKFVTYVLMLITLIEMFFYRPTGILQISELLSMGIFSCMLMDYENLYVGIIYYHHILVYLGC